MADDNGIWGGGGLPARLPAGGLSVDGVSGSARNQRNAIHAAAAEWVVRFGGSPPSALELAAFQAWLDERPEHKEAFEYVRGIWLDFGTMRTGADVISQGLLPDSEQIRQRRRSMALVAAVILLLVACVSWCCWEMTSFNRNAPARSGLVSASQLRRKRRRG